MQASELHCAHSRCHNWPTQCVVGFGYHEISDVENQQNLFQKSWCRQMVVVQGRTVIATSVFRLIVITFALLFLLFFFAFPINLLRQRRFLCIGLAFGALAPHFIVASSEFQICIRFRPQMLPFLAFWAFRQCQATRTVP